MQMPYVYEVNIVGPNKYKTEFSRWLDGHVSRLLELPLFSSAEIKQLDGHGDQFVFRVLYTLPSKSHLTEYLSKHAEKMRGELPDFYKDILKYSRFQYPLA